MALYNRHNIHWDLSSGDLVGYFRNPFNAKQDVEIFRVLRVSDDQNLMDLEVVYSSFIEIGTIYTSQPNWGFKKLNSPYQNWP